MVAVISAMGVVVRLDFDSEEYPSASVEFPVSESIAVRHLNGQTISTSTLGLVKPSNLAVIPQSPSDFWQQVNRINADELVVLAMKNLINSNEPHAVRALEAALTTASTDASTAYSIAELLAAGGRDAGYLHWLSQALARHPKIVQGETNSISATKDAYLTVFGAALRTDAAAALALSQMLAADLPGDPDITALRAQALLLLGYRQQAIDEMGSMFVRQKTAELDAATPIRHEQANIAGQRYFEILTQAGDESAALQMASWLASRRTTSKESAKPVSSDFDAGT